MKYRISWCNPHPIQVAALREATQEEWDATTKGEIMGFCLTMAQRFAALVSNGAILDIDVMDTTYPFSL